MSIRKGAYNTLLLVQFFYILETILEIQESKRKKKYIKCIQILTSKRVHIDENENSRLHIFHNVQC